MMSKRFTKLLLCGFLMAWGPTGPVIPVADAQQLAEGCVLSGDPQDTDRQVLTCPSGRYTTWAEYCEGQHQVNIRDYCRGEYCRPPINSLMPDGCLIGR